MNIKNYKLKLQYLIDEIDENFINSLVKKIKLVNKKKGKIFIIGNGGSISTANHISVDLSKNAKIDTIQLFNSNLITCYSNDYGYENWISKTIDHFLNSKDLVIFLSVSGNSKNLLNAAKTCIKKKINTVALTGLSKKNKLNKIVKNNFWVNSKIYNLIHDAHKYWFLLMVDLMAIHQKKQ